MTRGLLLSPETSTVGGLRVNLRGCRRVGRGRGDGDGDCIPTVYMRKHSVDEQQLSIGAFSHSGTVALTSEQGALHWYISHAKQSCFVIFILHPSVAHLSI